MSKYGVEGGDVVPNPISFKEYLRSMMNKKTWGEDVVLYALSCMYDLKITVLQAQSLHEFRFRHNQPLHQVDMVLVYTGSNHYLYASKYRFLDVSTLFRWTSLLDDGT